MDMLILFLELINYYTKEDNKEYVNWEIHGENLKIMENGMILILDGIMSIANNNRE